MKYFLLFFLICGTAFGQAALTQEVIAIRTMVAGSSGSGGTPPNSVSTPLAEINTSTAASAANLAAASMGATSATAPVSAFMTGGIYRSTAGTLTNGQSAPFNLTARGDAIVQLRNQAAQAIKLGPSNGASMVADLDTTQLVSQPRLFGGDAALWPMRQPDALSNTSTANGAALVGPGYVQYGPVTITGTGTSTPMTLTAPTGHMPFDQWTCQCKATGTLTAVTTRFEGSADLANYDATTPLTTENTFVNDGQIFFAESKYVRAIRFNTSLFTIGAGTNFICTAWGKGF